MAHKALDVAKFIVETVTQADELITHLKLQKLVYYAQAWYMVHKGELLFDDDIEAWKHGPVVRDVYYFYDEYKREAIKANDETSAPDETLPKEIIKDFLEEMKDYNTSDLYGICHYDDQWIEAYATETDPKKIETTDIFKYYTRNPKHITKKTILSWDEIYAIPINNNDTLKNSNNITQKNED